LVTIEDLKKEYDERFKRDVESEIEEFKGRKYRDEAVKQVTNMGLVKEVSDECGWLHWAYVKFLKNVHGMNLPKMIAEYLGINIHASSFVAHQPEYDLYKMIVRHGQPWRFELFTDISKATLKIPLLKVLEQGITAKIEPAAWSEIEQELKKIKVP